MVLKKLFLFIIPLLGYKSEVLSAQWSPIIKPFSAHLDEVSNATDLSKLTFSGRFLSTDGIALPDNATLTLCARDTTKRDYCLPLSSITESPFSIDITQSIIGAWSSEYFLLASNEGRNAKSVSRRVSSDVLNKMFVTFKSDNFGLGDLFGGNVALSSSGNLMLLSAHSKDYTDEEEVELNTGGAYFLEKDPNAHDWVPKQFIFGSGLLRNDNFGYTSSLDDLGETALFGTLYGKRAYVFEKQGDSFLESAILKQSVVYPYRDYFGEVVKLSLSGRYAILSARHAGGDKTGSAYVFKKDESGHWSEIAILKPEDLKPGDEFSTAITASFDAEFLAISAPFQNNKSGAIYIYQRNEDAFNLFQKIDVVDDISSNANFGYSIGFSSDSSRLSIGAPTDSSVKNGGAVFIYDRNKDTGFWEFTSKIVDDDDNSTSLFGVSLAMSSDSNSILIGAIGDVVPGQSGGAASLFTFVDNSWKKVMKSEKTQHDWREVRYGFSVAISSNGSIALIGSYGGDIAAVGKVK